jgi:hypothetical protein
MRWKVYFLCESMSYKGIAQCSRQEGGRQREERDTAPSHAATTAGSRRLELQEQL